MDETRRWDGAIWPDTDKSENFESPNALDMVLSVETTSPCSAPVS